MKTNNSFQSDADIMLFNQLMIQFADQNDVLEKILNKYGVVKFLKSNKKNLDFKLHDFYYFCIAKACKSLNATETLIHNFIQEDSQTVLRTAYECYLNASFARFNPTSIINLIDYKLGLMAGIIQHPTSKKNKQLRNKIIDPITGEDIPYGQSIHYMAHNNGLEEDGPLFNHLYKHLSEHVHVNFMTSGNYRDEEELNYTIYNQSLIFQPAFHGILISVMIISDFLKFTPKVEKKFLSEIHLIIKNGLNYLFKISKLIQDEESQIKAILNRLKKIEQTIK